MIIQFTKTIIFLCLLVVIGFLLASNTSTAQDNEAPILFHCSLDENCPEILIEGDPHAQLGGNPSPFRGYGDPSLEYDSSTDTLWLSYSWLDVLAVPTDSAPLIDLGVRTHLAQSKDNGKTFQFVRAINEPNQMQHPNAELDGWIIHEVSTLVHEANGNWQVMWLSYFDPLGDNCRPFRFSLHTVYCILLPKKLGNSSETWIRGFATPDLYGTRHNLSNITELSDCVAFTEPALFSGWRRYLFSNWLCCV